MPRLRGRADLGNSAGRQLVQAAIPGSPSVTWDFLYLQGVEPSGADDVVRPGLTPGAWLDRRQQRTRLAANPPSLVSLYFVLMSRPVSARVLMVVSRSTRCRAAISLVAITKAIQALTAPKAQRSMQGTCTYPATGSQVIPRWCSSADSAAFSMTRGELSMAWAMNAADMAEATPISDWQPPSA